ISNQAMILTAPFQGVPNPSKFHGMTLSSVCSLVVNPEPVIQFNLQIPSITSEHLHKYNYLALHIMKPSNDSVNLARTFSKGIKVSHDENGQIQHTKPFELLEKSEWDIYDNGSRYPLSMNSTHENVFIDDINLNIPILTKNSERILICEKYKVFQIYNHEIWTCKVKDIIVNDDVSGIKTGGLLYFNRQFHTIGDALKEPNQK
ncbi:hypothetical protein CANARDRAFT_193088, partial [[Candida] arabinofermentans NRRL YB-2248]